MKEFWNQDKIRTGQWQARENNYNCKEHNPWAMEVDKNYQSTTNKKYNNKIKKGNCHKCGKPGH